MKHISQTLTHLWDSELFSDQSQHFNGLQCLPFIFCWIPTVLLHQSTVNGEDLASNGSWHNVFDRRGPLSMSSVADNHSPWHCDRNVVQKCRTWLLMSYLINYTRPFSDMLVLNQPTVLVSGLRILHCWIGVECLEESEAQVESTSPSRWQGASGLWWRHGGREWNQTLTRDLWLHTCCSDTFNRVLLSLSRLSSGPPFLSVAIFLFSAPSFTSSAIFSYTLKLKIDSRLRGLNSFKVTKSENNNSEKAGGSGCYSGVRGSGYKWKHGGCGSY